MNPQLRFAFGHELIVDLFAGGGGASLRLAGAEGRIPEVLEQHPVLPGAQS